MKLIAFKTGDWSNDGHGQTETHIYRSNKTAKEITNAYSQGCDVIGIDMIKSFCRKYQDDEVPISFIALLFNKTQQHDVNFNLDNFYFAESVGFEEIDFSNKDTQQGMFYLGSSDWDGLYRLVCLLGDSELILDKVMLENVLTGGYGVFT